MGKKRGKAVRRKQAKKQGQKVELKQGEQTNMAKKSKKSTGKGQMKKQGTACTHGNKLRPVLQFPARDGVSEHMLWAGGSYDVKEAIQGGNIEPALIINLGGQSQLNNVKALPPKANAKKPTGIGFLFGANEVLPGLKKLQDVPVDESEPYPILTIDWPDMGVPSFDREWWVTLVDELRKIDGDITVNCMAGHGRTGTALSIIAYLSGACPKDEDPVDWMRGVYCERIVETKGQCNYIASILGIKINAAGSKDSPMDSIDYFGYGGQGKVYGLTGTSSMGGNSGKKEWSEEELELEMQAQAKEGAMLLDADFSNNDNCAICDADESPYYEDVDAHLCKHCAVHRGMWVGV